MNQQYYKENGDNGEQSEQLFKIINIKMVIDKLSPKDKGIVEMIESGQHKKDIIKKYKTNYPYIIRLLKKIRKQIDEK
jgi:hypothetical protein